MSLETIQGRTIFNGSRNGIPCCRRAVAEDAPNKICRHIRYSYQKDTITIKLNY